jgi:hypothetical protein
MRVTANVGKICHGLLGSIASANSIVARNTRAADGRRRARGRLCIFLIAYSCIGFFADGLMAQSMDSSAPDMWDNWISHTDFSA